MLAQAAATPLNPREFGCPQVAFRAHLFSFRIQGGLQSPIRCKLCIVPVITLVPAALFHSLFPHVDTHLINLIILPFFTASKLDDKLKALYIPQVKAAASIAQNTSEFFRFMSAFTCRLEDFDCRYTP